MTTPTRTPEAVRIGGLLKDARERSGLTRLEVARALGMSRSHLNNLELGNRALVPHVAIAAARLLGTDPAAFLSAPAPSSDRGEVMSA